MTTIQQIPTDQIKPGYNDRTVFDQAGLAKFTERYGQKVLAGRSMDYDSVPAG
jgi:hypothetical protein